MIWFLFAILSGFFIALSDALNKKYFSSEGFPSMLTARLLGSFPFLFPVFLYLTFFKKTFSYFTLELAFTTLILLFLEIIANILYMKGIQVSPLSLSLPFLSFTPIFIIFTGYLILGEKVSLLGSIGIAFIIMGSYTINLPIITEGLTAPIKAIFREKGSFLLLQVALIYSLTSVLGKKGLLLTDPLWFASFLFSLLGIIGSLMVKFLYSIKLFILIKNNFKAFLAVGLTHALMCIFQMIALSGIEAAYMIALKRTSILFAVILGYFFFKEKHFWIRILASSLMFVGIIFITLAKS